MSPEFYKTEKGTLETGILYEGEARRDYVIREEKLSDNLRENEQIEQEFGESGSKDPTVLELEKNCVQFSRRVTISGIPKDVLTAKFLVDHLSSRDYSELRFKRTKLDKEIFRALGLNPDKESDDSTKKN